MNRWMVLGTLVTVIAVGGIVGSVLSSGVSVQVAKARQDEIREYIDERGKTRVPRLYQITTPQPGRIQEIALAALDISVDGVGTELVKLEKVPERTGARMLDGDVRQAVETLVRILKEEEKVI